MIEKITPQIHNKLEKIGFKENEINTFKIIHELNRRTNAIDLKKLINQAAFESLSKGISETFEKNQWDEEAFYEIVENHRSEKKQCE